MCDVIISYFLKSFIEFYGRLSKELTVRRARRSSTGMRRAALWPGDGAFAWLRGDAAQLAQQLHP